MSKRTITVEFGALAPTIHEQFPELSARFAKSAERVADSITFLGIHGYLTESAKDGARKKLLKAICREISSHQNSAVTNPPTGEHSAP